MVFCCGTVWMIWYIPCLHVASGFKWYRGSWAWHRPLLRPEEGTYSYLRDLIGWIQMSKRVSRVVEIAKSSHFSCSDAFKLQTCFAELLHCSFLFPLLRPPRDFLCQKHRLGHGGHGSCHWGPLKEPHETYGRIVQDARNNQLTALTKSNKRFPLSVGLLMAYLQAESISNSGRFFVTWAMHGVEINFRLDRSAWNKHVTVCI